MSFSPFSFNPTSIKNESMKYFQKRQTKIYILRYRCPNDEIFDPTTHLTGLKSVFLTPNRELLINMDSMKEDTAENVLTEDLLSLGITAPPEQCIKTIPKTKQKESHIHKQPPNFFNESESNSNNLLPHKTHSLLDELTQSDVYYVNNSNDILKRIFGLIKAKNHEEAFEQINKSINIYSQFEFANYLAKKRNLSGLILYIAFIGFLLGISTHDISKQYEYLDIISDYPINQSDLPHFYHLYDEILLTTNGINQLTLAHLLGFPQQFFIPTNIDPNAQNRNNFRRYKNRSRSVFNHIMNKKFRLNPNEPDYDNDEFNEDYSDIDDDYYDFESDSEMNFFDEPFESCDDFDYDFLRNQQALDDIPPGIKNEFFNKTFKLRQRRKLIDMKMKKKVVKEELNSSSKKSNGNVKDKKEKNDNDSSKWKTVINDENESNNSKKSNVFLFKKGVPREIKINPLFNVVFYRDPNVPYLPRINQYFAYRASNSSKIVNCNFIPSPDFSHYIGFNNNEYNYCCLPHFIQTDLVNKSINDDRITENGKDCLVSKYIKMTETKDTVKSLYRCPSPKAQMPMLTCSIPSNEIDDDLADEIKTAIKVPDLFPLPKPKTSSKMFLKPNQDNDDDLIDLNSCDYLKKPNTNQKNAKSSSKNDSNSGFDSSFRSPFGSDDDDFDDDGNYAILNNMLKKDILSSQSPEAFQILSQINPIFSTLKNEINNSDAAISSKKSYVVQTPGKKTTTEIKIGNGTTITKITTTTSNITFQKGSKITDDDFISVSNPPPRSSKDKRKKRRDGK